MLGQNTVDRASFMTHKAYRANGKLLCNKDYVNNYPRKVFAIKSDGRFCTNKLEGKPLIICYFVARCFVVIAVPNPEIIMIITSREMFSFSCFQETCETGLNIL